MEITATYAPCMRRATAKGHSYDVAFNVLTNARGPARSFIVFPQIAFPPYMGHPVRENIDIEQPKILSCQSLQCCNNPSCEDGVRGTSAVIGPPAARKPAS